MRLLSTKPSDGALRHDVLELHNFQTVPEAEPYAILSHTWGRLIEEVLFADLMRLCDKDVLHEEGLISVDTASGPGVQLSGKPGWHKLHSSLKQAWADGIQWLWADTACIDKSSSAELSEAINSMWYWYYSSEVCYAFLADVSSESSRALLEQGRLDSRWATRGWTLQELLAPSRVHFFSSDWYFLGNKCDLAEALHKSTNIDVAVLRGQQSMESTSIAKRMSWAADRQTTRPEDRSYSLMGLFGVNMPMLYGEGNKAFLRLQEEIMRQSNDHSLLAWRKAAGRQDGPHGLLADSPEDFQDSSRYRPYTFIPDPLAMTSRGLSISLDLKKSSDDPSLWLARLQCPDPNKMVGFLVIYLRKLSTGDRDFARVRCSEISVAPATITGESKAIFVPQKIPPDDEREMIMPVHVFQISIKHLESSGPFRLLNIRSDSFSSTLRIGEWTGSPPQQPLALQMRVLKNCLSHLLIFGTPITRRTLVILLGTDKSSQFGWDCVQRSVGDSLCSLKQNFDPKPFDRSIRILGHVVSLKGQVHLRPDGMIHVHELAFRKESGPPAPPKVGSSVGKSKVGSKESSSPGGTGMKRFTKMLTWRKTSECN